MCLGSDGNPTDDTVSNTVELVKYLMNKYSIRIDNKWYYLDSSWAMQTGWINDGVNDFCLYSDGSMMCNTTAYGYKFDSSGIATKLS